MSEQYKNGEDIPNTTLADRLDVLADAITKGPDAMRREFTMRVPAERDRDADLVLTESAKRLRRADLEAEREREITGWIKAALTHLEIGMSASARRALHKALSAHEHRGSENE